MGPGYPAPFALLRLYRGLIGADTHKIIYRLAFAVPCCENPFRRLFHDFFYIRHGKTRAGFCRYRAGKRGSHLLVIGIRIAVIPRGVWTELTGECIGQKLRKKRNRFRGLGFLRGRLRGLRLGLNLGFHDISLYGN